MYPNIGKQYQFLKEIGRGGTGVVHLAVDTHSGYLVAIKSIHSNISNSNPEMLEKFRIEANIYLMLSNPNIVKLKNFILQNGAHLVMEFVDGQPMDEYISNVTGPIANDITIAMMIDIVSAVGYAHNTRIALEGYDGVLHLDIKPGNILIGKKGEVKVIDYGISQGTHEERGKKIMGSPMYMSPEQLDLNAELNPQTDIYALGVLLHHMITGNTPYSRKSSQEEIFHEIKNKPLKRIVDIYPFADPRLQIIIDKATNKFPHNRYKNCNEFLLALEDLN
jgi:serine/threonine protein kinase|tara:strand:- start:4060 stop:4893 length:834 start_codon:yes stop_codon:yes gene_type:complete